MRHTNATRLAFAAFFIFVGPLQAFGQEGQAPQTVTYTLSDDAGASYPTTITLPDPYKKYYQGMTADDVIELFTKDSLTRDGISFTSVDVKFDSGVTGYDVTIETNDPNASRYSTVHPKFIDNYSQAEIGAAKCQAKPGCWNKNNTHEDEPWAFFPQFGLPMVMQRSVLMLNYPPTTALTQKDYLNTFTMNRWTRVLKAIGIDNPTLYETIVDIRPIAAPGSGTSQNLPDAQTYFNDTARKTGGYYINPQLALMVDPVPESNNYNHSLPLVVLGTPARDEWNNITDSGTDILGTGTATIPGASKPTPYIMGNHPDVTTYQCCPKDPSSQCGSFDLIADEEVDVQIACWAQAMSENPDADPQATLANCKNKWVTNRSPDDDLTFCALARIDSNECFGKDLDWATAINYCKSNDNNPCASYACPTKSPRDSSGKN